MSRTRWKLMIGSLGLGLGGLAAIADTPGKPGISCAPVQTHVAAKPPAPTIPPLPTPKPALELPALPAAPKAEPLTPAIPTLPLPPLPGANDAPKPLALPALPAAKGEMTIPPLPAFKPDVTAPALPSAPIPAQSVGDIHSGKLENPSYTYPPRPGQFQEGVMVQEVKTNLKDGTITPVGAPLGPIPSSLLTEHGPEPEIKPKSGLIDESLPSFAGRKTVAFDAPPKPALSEVKPVAVNVTPARAEKKLQVLLHMGDERPKFEVRDGEVVYLQVTSEKVDVKSPTDSVEANLSTMRATGKVRFVTPGGEGTCDDLSVVPGSGQVTVVGHVAFTYSWGKVETTVTGDKMTFRLGDAPAGSR